MKSTLRQFLALLTALALVPALSHGGQPAVDSKICTFDPASPFDRGMREFQIGAGAFFSLNNGGATRPTINDVDVSVRLGWMLNTPGGENCFRGNFEFLVEGFGAAVVEGPGDGMGGINLLLRYNFVQPDARLVPYFQIGAGGLLNDIYKEQPQRLVGQNFEWNLQAGFGLRYMCTDRLAFFAEMDIRHISNANQGSRNLGLNSVGGLLGVSCFF